MRVNAFVDSKSLSHRARHGSKRVPFGELRKTGSQSEPLTLDPKLFFGQGFRLFRLDREQLGSGLNPAQNSTDHPNHNEVRGFGLLDLLFVAE